MRLSDTALASSLVAACSLLACAGAEPATSASDTETETSTSGDGDGDSGGGDGDGEPPEAACISLDFDGLDDSLGAAPLEAETFTVELWFRPHDTERGLIVEQKAVNSGFQLWYWNDQLRVDFGDGEANTAALYFGVTADQWYHVAALYDGFNARIAVDGVIGSPSPPKGYLPVDSQLTIGGNVSKAPDDYFEGEIHALRISEGVRYEVDFEPPAVFEDDEQTLRLWQLDEGMGEIASDEASASADSIDGASWVMSCPGA